MELSEETTQILGHGLVAGMIKTERRRGKACALRDIGVEHGIRAARCIFTPTEMLNVHTFLNYKEIEPC